MCSIGARLDGPQPGEQPGGGGRVPGGGGRSSGGRSVRCADTARLAGMCVSMSTAMALVPGASIVEQVERRSCCGSRGCRYLLQDRMRSSLHR